MRLLFSIILLLNTFISWSQTIQQDEKNIKKNIQLGNEAKLAKEYEKAVSYYKLGAIISKKYKSAFIDELITCYSNQAFCEYMLGDYENAAQTYRTNLILIDKKYGNNSIEYAFDLYILSGCEKARQHYEIAIELYEEAKAIFKTKFGIYDINYANCFLRQAEIQSYFPDKKNKLKAIDNFEFYLNFEKDRGKTTEPYRTYLFSHGLNFMELNFIYSLEQKKDSAAIFLNKAKESFREIYLLETDSKEPNFESIKSTLSQLAEIDIREEKYSLALKKYKKIIEIENKNNPGITYDKIYYLSEIGDVYLKLNNLKKASEVEKTISKEIDLIMQVDPKKALLILSNMASFYNKANKTQEEIRIRNEILSLQNKVYPIDCNKYSALEHALIGQAYQKIEKGDSVFYHYQKNKELILCIYGKNSREYIESIFKQTLYASFYQKTDEDDQKLLNLFAEFDTLEKQNLLTAEDINNILSYKQEYYQRKGNLAKLLSIQRNQKLLNSSINNEDNILLLINEAENLGYSGQYLKAYELTKRIFAENPDLQIELLKKLLRCSVNLPMMAKGDIEESFRLAKWSVELHSDEKLWEENSNNLKHYLNQVSTLSTILLALKKNDEAIELLKQNLAISQKYLNANDNSVYTIYYELGNCFFLKNENSEAIKFIKKAQSYDVKLNNTIDPLYISSLKQLAYCYISEGQFLKSDTLMISHLEKEIKAVKEDIVKLSEQDMPYRKLDAINAISAFINYAVMRYKENPSLLILGLNNWLYFNDLQKKQSVFANNQSSESELLSEYYKVENQISQALQLPLSIREQEHLNIMDLSIKKRKIETEIKEKTNKITPEPNLEFLQNKLKTHQNYVIVIPYIHIPLMGLKGSDISPKIGKLFYLVACLNKEKGLSDHQIIENIDDLENDLFEEYEVYIKNNKDEQTSNTIVYENYFKPIERFFTEKKTFFCPAGIYNDLNLEAIYHPEKKDLLINLYDFQYVMPNKYDFNENKSFNLKKVALFGDIEFGDGVSKAQKQNEILKEYGVIGINTSISESKNIRIDKVELGLPAELAGIHENDEIIEIDAEVVNLENNDLSYYSSKVRGPALTQVNLKVLRPESNSTLSFSITRAQSVIAKPEIAFKNLPGTKDEINNIAEILRRKDISTEVYSQQEANELNLKKTENVDILHIATHSFFVDPHNIANSTFVGILEKEFSVSPFLFNGLVLADVNNFFYPEMTLNKENGFVNGLEISLLNLKETELVIISGCESGKATYGIGESKFGFKEALFRAGVKNVILSDFNIDDKATAEFYSTFYTILTDKKMSIEETLKETKKEMQKKYKHPYYWAAFQLYSN